MNKKFYIPLIIFLVIILPVSIFLGYTIVRSKENNQENKQPIFVDISEKFFKDFGADDETGYNKLYIDVWTQIGTWADPAVTFNDIENDKKMNIIIYSNRDPKLPVDPTNTGNLSHNKHRVTIEVKADDSYFKVQEETEYTINIGYLD